MLGKLSCQAWLAGAVRASPAHLVALEVSEEPGGHEAPECLQSPRSCRPHLDQDASNQRLSGLEGILKIFRSNAQLDALPHSGAALWLCLLISSDGELRTCLDRLNSVPSTPLFRPWAGKR